MNEYTKAELDFACAVLLQRFQEGTRGLEDIASYMLRRGMELNGVDEARDGVKRRR